MENDLLVKIVKKSEIGKGLYKFSLASNELLNGKAGEYIEVRVVDGSGIDTYKKVPIFNIDKESQIVEFIVDSADEDSKIISGYEIGDLIGAKGPKGDSFDTETKYNSVSIIAEGKNAFPIYEVAKELKGNASLNVYLEFNSKDDVVLEREIEEIGVNKLCITTIDGSYKESGNVSRFMMQDIKEHMVEKIFATGSKEFLKDIKAFAEENKIKVEAIIDNKSTENGFVVDLKNESLD